jgi:plastocyanin
MNRNVVRIILVVLVTTLGVSAGTINGKISGVSGESVVYVDTIQGKTFPPPGEHPVVNQKGLMFQPHILVVQAGTTVDFLNSDKVAHNAFWPSFQQGAKRGPGKNLGTWPQGEKRSFKFDQPGVAPLLCNVHAEMSGYIVVVPTPYFATTDSGGNYKIENVPDGQYNVVGWHEGIKNQTKPVAVSGDAQVDMTLSK